jgi:hypothetical protein
MNCLMCTMSDIFSSICLNSSKNEYDINDSGPNLIIRPGSSSGCRSNPVYRFPSKPCDLPTSVLPGSLLNNRYRCFKCHLTSQDLNHLFIPHTLKRGCVRRDSRFKQISHFLQPALVYHLLDPSIYALIEILPWTINTHKFECHASHFGNGYQRCVLHTGLTLPPRLQVTGCGVGSFNDFPCPS